MPNYPVPYQQNSWGYNGVSQQMYPQYNQSMQQMPVQQTGGLIWVDGEVGAKAYQMPQGLPANQPIALWDTNDTIIYLKSVNPMGMPNPIQKARYTLEENKQKSVSRDESRDEATQYVRKEDMERMKQELMEAISSANTSGAARRTASKGE